MSDDLELVEQVANDLWFRQANYEWNTSSNMVRRLWGKSLSGRHPAGDYSEILKRAKFSERALHSLAQKGSEPATPAEVSGCF